MPTNQSYDLYCPECDKKADAANPMFIRYSARRLQLPIFLCSECRTIYIDKPIVRRIISEWRKNDAITRKIPFEFLCREFLGEIEKSVRTMWVPKFGYRKVRFLKRPTDGIKKAGS